MSGLLDLDAAEADAMGYEQLMERIWRGCYSEDVAAPEHSLLRYEQARRRAAVFASLESVLPATLILFVGSHGGHGLESFLGSPSWTNRRSAPGAAFPDSASTAAAFADHLRTVWLPTAEPWMAQIAAYEMGVLWPVPATAGATGHASTTGRATGDEPRWARGLWASACAFDVPDYLPRLRAACQQFPWDMAVLTSRPRPRPFATLSHPSGERISRFHVRDEVWEVLSRCAGGPFGRSPVDGSRGSVGRDRAPGPGPRPAGPGRCGMTTLAASTFPTTPFPTARARRSGQTYPLVSLSWDITTEHDRLAPHTDRYAPWVDAFMVGPYANDEAAIDLTVEYCGRHGLTPLVHALDLDLCGLDPLDPDVLRGLRTAAQRLGVEWITADLAMWSWGGQPLVDNLVAIPWVEGVVEHVVPRVRQIQDALGVQVAIENSSYAFGVGDLDPFAVQAIIADEADAVLCFDVGHALITAEVIDADPYTVVPADFPWSLVVEGHVAGVTSLQVGAGVTSDDQHRAPIADRIWDLAAATLGRAENLVVWVAESEGISAPDLARKVAAMHAQVRQW